MFKRANKITSLLVAAAAVVSLVPASAADVKKIDSEDGTIYNAVAFEDGKAYVDGELNDEEAAYYSADGELTALEDVDSGDDVTLFGEKYLDVDNGDYTVDLSAGTVNDDDIVGDTADDAAASLRKKIKDDTDDRYSDATSGGIKEESDLNLIPGAKFGKVWYYTEYDQTNGSKANNNDTATSSATLNVFTDTEGNYIDADYNLGKIKVTTTVAGAADKTVTVENTNDTYDAAGTTGKDKLSVKVSGQKVLTQDADYIYRTVTVTVKTNVGTISEINGKAVGTGVLADSNSGQIVTFPAIQKISKAQSSDDVDGANYAKTVTTYVLSNDDATQVDGFDVFVDAADAQYTIVGGKLIAYSTGLNAGKVTVRAYSLKSKSSYYYADAEDQSKEDIEKSAQDNTPAVEVGADGNLYRLDGGYIYKFDNTDDWDKLYKVDGSFDELSVYDEDNMVAWSEDDEVYSLIGGKTTTDGETPVETPVVTAGWAQAANGAWTYNKADGTKATGWLLDGATWYYLKADGVMATGWVQDGATWYYTNASGAMQTGWINDNGTWYYTNASGAMLANTTVDGYVLGASGAWVK